MVLGAAISKLAAHFRLNLLGTFRLIAPDGKRIDIASRRGIALVAMLAMAPDGERTRTWLQDRLWSRRQRPQSQSSLRRELSNVRKCLRPHAAALLSADHHRVRLNLDLLHVDALGTLPVLPSSVTGEFLEGFDIEGEEGVEDWLREQRQALGARFDTPSAAVGDTFCVVSVAVAGRAQPELSLDELSVPVEQYGGSFHLTIAGGVVACFAAADAAVAFALEIASSGRCALRIGVAADLALADCRVLRGPAVDTAVGIQRAARVGTILCSRNVLASIAEPGELAVVECGVLDLAGAVGPVEVVQIVPAQTLQGASTRLPPRLLDVSQPAPGFDGRSALAVLPLENHTEASANDYVAEGISEELINRLSRLRWLPVIARSSSFSFGSGSATADDIALRLGAKYVVQGHLRLDDDQFLISVRLSEASSAVTLSSHRFALPRTHAQVAIDGLVAELVTALDARIDRAEQLRSRDKHSDMLDVHDMIWRGRWHLNRLTHADSETARELFAEALAREPDSAEALIQATFGLGWAIWAGRESQARVAEMRRMAQAAIIADPDDGRGHMLAGIAEMWLRQPMRAQALLRQAISLNPSLAQAHAQLGGSYNLAGEAALAIEPLQTAMRLSPNDVHLFYPLGELAMANALLANWSVAVEYADQALVRRPSYWYALVIKINALARSGDLSAAGFAFDELLSRKADFSERYIRWLPFVDGAWNDFLIGGLALVPSGRTDRFTAPASARGSRN